MIWGMDDERNEKPHGPIHILITEWRNNPVGISIVLIAAFGTALVAWGIMLKLHR